MFKLVLSAAVMLIFAAFLASCNTRSMVTKPTLKPTARAELDLSDGTPKVNHDVDVNASTTVAGVGTVRANKQGLTMSTDIAARAEDKVNEVLFPDAKWVDLNVKLFQQQRHSVSVTGHPERSDYALDASAFDRKAWRAKPEATATAYAAIAEPGRVRLQGSADAGDATIALIGVSSAKPVPGMNTQIQVRAAPFAPVSVYTPAKVTFENGLNYGTVIADADGLAVLNMQIAGQVNLEGNNAIVIASPVNAQRINLTFATK